MELYHHGIKGQRWGERNGPPYPISEEKHSPSEKKAGWKDSIKNQGSSSVRVKKGTQFNRVSNYDEALSKGYAYVTYLKSDSEKYKGFLAKARAKQGDVYQVKLTALEDIVSPGQKERIDAFIKIYENVKAEKLSFNSLKTRFRYSQYDSDLGGEGYRVFMNELGNKKNTYLREKYFDELKNRGYNSVVDDNDAGRYANKPLIVFDRNKSFKYEGQDKISNKEIDENYKKYGYRLKNPKGIWKRKSYREGK